MRLAYHGDPGRHYPTLRLVVDPGDVHDLPDDPGDGRWKPLPDNDSAPSTDTPLDAAGANDAAQNTGSRKAGKES